jgi:O-antigen/teichoic acid export membrane protein
VLRGDFQIAKWTGAIQGVAAVSTYAWPAILSAVAGLRANAGFGVISQIFGPLRLFLRPFENYYVAETSRAVAREGTAGVNRILSWAALLFAPPYLLYLLLVGLFGPTLLPVIFGEPYREHGGALRLFAIAAVLHLPTAMLVAEIQARRLLHVSLLDVATGAVLTYTVGLFLVSRWGLMGVAVSYVLAAVLQVSVLAVFVARARMGSGSSYTRP